MRNSGGILQPDDTDSKTGRPILEVLQSKHPAMRDTVIKGDWSRCFKTYNLTLEPIPLEITVDVMETIASRLSGGAGPGGTDVINLCDWLLCFSTESKQLRIKLAALTE